jgi:hypothetical protein
MSSGQDHGAYVDLDAFDSTLAGTRLARLGLDALLESLPADLRNTAAEDTLWEIHDRICEKELADLRLWGVTQQYLIIRPINPARPPAPEDIEKITAAIRTLASLGLIAGRGSDRREAGA